MNKEEPIRDQAEKLRKRMTNVGEIVDEVEQTAINSTNEKLPPRSRLHKQKQMEKKTKVKVKFPLIRLLSMFFILLPIVIFSIYTYNDSHKSSGSHVVEEKGVEAVYYTEKEEEADSILEEVPATEEEPSLESETKSGDATKENTETFADQPQEQPGEQTESTTTTTNSALKTEVISQPVEQNVIYHKVQPGETIFRIAMKYYKSQSGIDIIKKANSLTSNEISVGQTLTIPLSK